jgi:hypothetical protein
VSDEPSNAASEFLRFGYSVMNEFGSPPGDAETQFLWSSFADDFTYEDRHRGPRFASGDAEMFRRFIESAWETGAGRPRWTVRAVLAVRGDRLAAQSIELDYGNGFTWESITLIELDAGLSLMQRAVDFDVDDVDAAVAELDRVHGQADAS